MKTRPFYNVCEAIFSLKKDGLLFYVTSRSKRGFFFISVRLRYGRILDLATRTLSEGLKDCFVQQIYGASHSHKGIVFYFFSPCATREGFVTAVGPTDVR